MNDDHLCVHVVGGGVKCDNIHLAGEVGAEPNRDALVYRLDRLWREIEQLLETSDNTRDASQSATAAVILTNLGAHGSVGN